MRVQNRVRRRGPLAIAVPLSALLTAALAGCTESSPGQAPAELELQRQRRREHERRCELDRRALPPLLAALQRSDRQLADLEAEVYVPTPGPAPLDPEEQRRLAFYDQEVEQEQYDRVKAHWQDRERQRRQRWQRQQAERLASWRQERASVLADLRQAHSSFADAASAAAIRQAALLRLRRCASRPLP